MKRTIRKLKNLYHLIGAYISNIRYGWPSKKITVIGVTGTDGKTTTSHLIYHILNAAGKRVSISTTVYADIAGEESDTGLHVTTQSHKDVQKNLRKAVDRGSEFFVLETTSHGIDQNRVFGVAYDVGVITNITPEHLDYHETFEHYLMTKTKLALRSRHAIINKDDESYEKVSAILDSQKKPYDTYSLESKDATVTWSSKIKTSLKEDFNKENILAAFACCLELGLTEKEILYGIKTFELPKGRFETAYSNSYKVIVDFAHTPNSIRRLLRALKTDSGRIIHVFGSAGERDYKKRPDMGRASGEYADLVIITEEDYRSEDFNKITQSVSQGLFENAFSYVESHTFPTKKKGEKQFTTVRNRQSAIDLAIATAKKGDIVAITGKGHEQSLARGKSEYAWDEFKAVDKALENRKSGKS